jgi:uncharacterized protein YndB with AHSA1/START domain
MSDDSVVIDVYYPQAVPQVWAALTSSAALAAWLMPNDFEPRVGHCFTFRTTPDQFWDGTVYCEVVTLDSPRQVAYTWKNETSRLDTLVTFTLEPADGGTHLRLEHTGFANSGPAGLSVRDMLGSGWNSRVLRERLPAYLAESATPHAQAPQAAKAPQP